MSGKCSYEGALEILNSSIAAVFIRPIISAADIRLQSIGRVILYLEAVGITATDIERLNIIHVTGSKGKGSVCAHVSSILKSCGYRTGLLSSPHLIDVEERIRIDGRPIDRDCFGRTFWSVHERIRENLQPADTPMPSFLQYLIVMACQVFVEEKVDAAIFEVGIGGRFDQTNFLTRPVVAVVTSITLEHTDILGNTLPEVAYAKAGIFKPGCHALVSAGLADEVMAVMKKEAETVGCPLYVAPSTAELVDNASVDEDMKRVVEVTRRDYPLIALANVGVSLAAVHLWLQRQHVNWDRPGLQPSLTMKINPEHFKVALTNRWPGRWHRIVRDRITYFVDGAHTVESIQSTASWFQQKLTKNTSRILLFTILGSRDPKPMLQTLMNVVKPAFDLAVFASPHDGRFVVLPGKQSADARCLDVWNQLQSGTAWTSNGASPPPEDHALQRPPTCSVHASSVPHFVDWLSRLPHFSPQLFKSYSQSNGSPPPAECGPDAVTSCHVLVTGSLYLVGSAMRALKEPV